MQSDNQHSGSLKDRFEGFGAEPSDGLWGNISGALDEKKKRRGIIWWWFGGLAAMVVVGFVMFKIGYNSGLNDADLKLIVQDGTEEVQTEDNNEIATSIDDEKVEIDEDVELVHQDYLEGHSKANQDQEIDSGTPVVTNEQTNSPILESDDLNISITQNHLQDSKEEHFDNRPDILKKPMSPILGLKHDIILPELGDFELTEIEKPEEDNKTWYWGFELNGNLAIGSPFVLKKALADMETYDQNQQPDSTSLMTESLSINNPETRTYRPISVGFLAGRYFGNRFAFQTGLEINRWVFKNQYTDSYLTTSGMPYNSNSLVPSKTVLWSVAIPIKLKYDLIQRDNWKWRLGSGVINEIPFYEKASPDVQLSTYDWNIKNARFGYFGALHFETDFAFRIKNNLWINVAPSYRWYFIQSVDTEFAVHSKRNWLGGSVGLIWNL